MFQTKKQMCEIFTSNELLLRAAFETVSCDRLPHEIGRQCGFCTSCVLRRQAFAAAGIEDRTFYASIDNEIRRDSHYNHVPATIQQVRRLRQLIYSDNPWRSLVSEYPDLYRIEQETHTKNAVSKQEMQRKLVMLFKSHVDEWEMMGDSLHEKLITE